MLTITITDDDAALRTALGELHARLGNLRAPMAEIGQALVTLADLSFRGERDPWGGRWAALRASTVRRRRGGGKGAKILRDSGRLAGSISYRADATSVRVGTNVVYAAIHQFGGDIAHQARTGTVYFKTNRAGTEVGNRFVRKGRSNFAQEVSIGAWTQHLPPRPFLPVTSDGQVRLPAETLDEVLGILHRHLAEAAQ